MLAKNGGTVPRAYNSFLFSLVIHSQKSINSVGPVSDSEGTKQMHSLNENYGVLFPFLPLFEHAHGGRRECIYGRPLQIVNAVNIAAGSLA